MGWLKKLLSKDVEGNLSNSPPGSDTSLSKSSNSKSDLDLRPLDVSGIGVVFQIPSPTQKEKDFLESQVREIYRALNPEFANALASRQSPVRVVHSFAKCREDAISLACKQGLNTVIQYRSILLPGLSTSEIELFVITWLTRPTKGEPSFMILGEEKIIPAVNPLN